MSKCIIPWTNAEDEAIIKVMGTLAKNESIGDAFKKLTKRLNRSNPAIQFRWYRVLKKQNISKPTKQPKSSIPDKNFSREELLEYARKHYPVGAKIKDLSNCIGVILPNSEIRYGMAFPNDIFIFNTKIRVYEYQLFDFNSNKWAEIISLPEQTVTTKSNSAETKPKQKGVFLDVNKLESLSISSLRELAVTKLVDVDKKKLIDLIVE